MAHSTVPAITKSPDTERHRAPEHSMSVPAPPVFSLFKSLRPAQWTKNLIVFAALMLGQRGTSPAFLDSQAILETVAAFAIFCALSGVVYLVNDVADRAKDRMHPLKQNRPIASGAVSPGLAVGTAVLLGAAALGAAYVLRSACAVVAVTYLALLVMYSGPLKHVVILGVLTNVVGFVL